MFMITLNQNMNTRKNQMFTYILYKIMIESKKKKKKFGLCNLLIYKQSQNTKNYI